MNAKQLTASLATVSLVATLGLVACDRAKTQASHEQPTTVGQKIDTAIDQTSQKISEAGDKTMQTLNEAGKKTEQALSTAGEKISAKTSEITTSISPGDQTTVSTTSATTTGSATTTTATEAKRTVSDAAITASIKTDLLKDPDLSVLKIDVDTKNGVVTLNGLAADETAKGRAEKMASAVKGVKEVRNFLVVKRA
jgi:osmotically-inducible protein OsmY